MVYINMLFFRSKQSGLLYLITLCAIWMVILLIATSFIYKLEMDGKEIKLQNIHDRIYSHVADTLKVYEVSIESFASMLTAEPNSDFEHARKFARQLRKHYPDIYMFEIAKRIPHSERDDLEQNMRELGYKDFVLHSFGYNSDRQKHPLPVKEFYYPVVFIEPELEQSEGVLGLDLSEGNSVLSEGLEKSFNLNTNVASRPFLLREGIRGYVLCREVNTNYEHYPDNFTSRHDLYA
ncbi:MAG: CHASE domain-containing protein, partial [Gammaproteobacteria bacterium]|nr:CHASE domain-containing protein [Gammaproteobacteria bacterium]